MPTAQFLLGKTSSGKFAIPPSPYPPRDAMVKYLPPKDRVNQRNSFSNFNFLF